MKEQDQTKSTNIKWHNLTIDREKLEKMRGHKGMVSWFTGLSGSGKSTLANALNEVLHLDGFSTYVLDGDNIRHGCSKKFFANSYQIVLIFCSRPINFKYLFWICSYNRWWHIR